MTTRIIIIVAVLSYAVIVSQSFMYLLALKNVQLSLDVSSYTELRKLIDINMRANFKYAIYAALISNLLLVVFAAKNPASILFITATIGFIALIAEVILTLKGNLPINDIINSWSASSYPGDWTLYRDKWFAVYFYRQVVTIVGFVSLVVGVALRK